MFKNKQDEVLTRMRDNHTFPPARGSANWYDGLGNSISRTETLGSGIWNHRSGLFLQLTSLGALWPANHSLRRWVSRQSGSQQETDGALRQGPVGGFSQGTVKSAGPCLPGHRMGAQPTAEICSVLSRTAHHAPSPELAVPITDTCDFRHLEMPP